jgi:hypothetical protein
MRKAFGNPTNREMDELIAFLESEGHLGDWETEVMAAHLDAPRIPLAHRALLKHYAQKGDLPAALLLLQNHPALADSASLESIRELSIQNKQFEPFANLLERLCLQPGYSRASLERNLGLTLAAWAEAELEAFQTAAAVAHLERATELAPEHFPSARRLAELQAQASNVRGAISTLEKFVAAAQLPAERESARQLLASFRMRL